MRRKTRFLSIHFYFLQNCDRARKMPKNLFFCVCRNDFYTCYDARTKYVFTEQICIEILKSFQNLLLSPIRANENFLKFQYTLLCRWRYLHCRPLQSAWQTQGPIDCTSCTHEPHKNQIVRSLSDYCFISIYWWVVAGWLGRRSRCSFFHSWLMARWDWQRSHSKLFLEISVLPSTSVKYILLLGLFCTILYCQFFFQKYCGSVALLCQC